MDLPLLTNQTIDEDNMQKLMHKFHTACALGFFLALHFASAYALDPDMAIITRWTSADLINFHVVGEYAGQPRIASNGAGRADVTDRVVIDLKWRMSTETLVGTPVIQNSKSVATNLRDLELKCKAPVLKGDYEHFELLGIKDGLAGALEMDVRTSYPVVDVIQFCSGSYKAVPARVDRYAVEWGVPSPTLFGMGLPPSDSLTISKDKKSLIVKRDGWTWTFTPTAAAK